MTREALENLIALKAEVSAIEKEIARIVPEDVADIYKDYTRDPSGVVKVMRGSNEGGDAMRRLQAKRRAFLQELREQIERAEGFIESIDDPEARVILRMVYLQGATQDEVGAALGYDRSTISRKVSAFWEKVETDG